VTDESVLTIRLLGGLRIERSGTPIKLPRSKKTRALLGYLVATERSHHRSRLCSLLWDVTDDPRAALRWCLTKLRPLVDQPDQVRIISDGQTVAFRTHGARVDIYDLKQTRTAGTEAATTEALIELADSFTGDMLEGLELGDFQEFAAWCAAERAEVRKHQCRVLAELLNRLADDPESAVPFARHQVHLLPKSTEARSGLLKILAATGRIREAEQQFQLGLDAFSEASVDDAPLRHAWSEAAKVAAATRAPKNTELRQEIRFCSARDGTSIAYARSGRGPVILKAANWLSHLEHDWDSPAWRHLYRELSSHNTLVRYDDRGCGLSDWRSEELSFEKFVEDLEDVADEVETGAFVLLGISKGASISIEYAVRHPQRVAGLVLVGGFATGWKQHLSKKGIEINDAVATLIRTGWGLENPAFRQIFTSLFLPNGTPEEIKWFNELQRLSSTPENAARFRDATGEIDVAERLGEVSVPTLIMHLRDDSVVPYRQGRELAKGIPNARFVTLEGANHLVLEKDPGWPRYLSELRAFLSEIGAHGPRVAAPA
jgi:pimeloyl-ACP methyl ester carboxylesterase/DNA-binding SARP family transcriptional activator